MIAVAALLTPESSSADSALTPESAGEPVDRSALTLSRGSVDGPAAGTGFQSSVPAVSSNTNGATA